MRNATILVIAIAGGAAVGWLIGKGLAASRGRPGEPAVPPTSLTAPAPATPSGTGPVVAPAPGPAPAAQAMAPVRVNDDGSLVLHLKAAVRVDPPFAREEDPSAAEGAAIAVPPKAGKAPGGVELRFHLPAAGVYSIWMRAFWGTDGEDACSNSLLFQLDDGRPVVVQDATYRVWHWVPVRFQGGEHPGAVELAAGPHRVLLQNREDGIKLDQVFVAPWFKDEFQRRIPQGIE